MNEINQYRNVQVMTADGVRIIIMLCEGVIRFNTMARNAIAAGDIEGRTRNINKSLDIINEFINSLNMEAGGEVAQNLSRLYDFSVDRLTSANLNNNTTYLDQVNKVIGELKSGWETVARESASADDAGARPETPSIMNAG